MYVQGSNIPGPMHAYVRVFDTKLPNRRKEIAAENRPPLMPTFFADDIIEGDDDLTAEEVYEKDLHPFSEASITFEDTKAKAKL